MIEEFFVKYLGENLAPVVLVSTMLPLGMGLMFFCMNLALGRSDKINDYRRGR